LGWEELWSSPPGAVGAAAVIDVESTACNDRVTISG
jgi:hypothetical protein